MMKFKIRQPVLQVVGLGVLAGMRSTAAPMITSHILSHHHSISFGRSAFGFMQSNRVANVLKVISVSELIADKLPATPNRIKPAVLTVRCLSGALAGASVFKAAGKNAALGGLIGAASACVSTFESYLLRKDTVKLTRCSIR